MLAQVSLELQLISLVLLCPRLPNYLSGALWKKAKLTKHRLPKKHDLLDWDCAEALSIPSIVKSLDYISKNGTFPVSQFCFGHISHASGEC